MQRKIRHTLLALLALVVTVPQVQASATGTAETVQAAADYEALVAIFEQAVQVRRVAAVDGVPDYSAGSVESRRAAERDLRQQLRALDPSAWPVSQQIDYLLVWAQLNAIDFDLRVVRGWARDPGLAVDLVRRTAYLDPTEDPDAARAALERIPRVLAAAQDWLTDASSELAGMAIRQMEMSDGVNQGEPRRAVPPAGVIGWYEDLVARVAADAPDLAPAAEAALAAVQGYRDWLVANRAGMDTPAWIGLDNYTWYLQNVLLMPFDAEDLRTIATRELERTRTFLAIERYRNRDLPEIVPVASAEEHAARVEEAEAHIRAFMTENELVSIPEGLPERFETDAFWIVREGGQRHFWEEITYRDPLNNHVHASIPGHRFDGLVQRRNTNPIRSRYRDGVRAEGWAFYIEEMFLQAGMLDDRPRSKELFYIAQLKRAARVPAELAMQTGDIDLAQAIDYLVEEVPLMEPDLARYDLAIYLRRPTYGMNYVMGKVQMESLLSARALQLGDAFDLGEYHDTFLAAGPIPMALIAWEMTGDGTAMEQLLETATR
ncbi:MAG: DUF885 family protein [Acidobacteria bacterium]|nr:DUF885 family protein [Acidobacteriota bacterium]